MNKRLFAAILLLISLFTAGAVFAGPADKFTPAIAAAAGVSAESGNSIVRIMNDITVPAGETVNGDVVAILGDIRIDGVVRGNAIAILGDIDLNNIVHGDVVSVLGDLRKGPNAQIYGQTVEASRPEDFRAPNINIRHFGRWSGINWGMRLFNLAVLFGLATLILALLPNQVRTMSAALAGDTGRKLLIGFVTVLLIPALFLITAISIIGIPLLPILALVLVAAKFIGYVAVALHMGGRIKNTAGMSGNIFLELGFGVLILWLVRLVPVFGWLSALLVTMFAFGLVIDTKFGTNNPWLRRRAVQPVGAPLPPARPDRPADETNEPEE